MAIQERWTDLPTVTNSMMTDIINAVQGYVSSSSLGLSTQQTLQQVYNLFQSTIILFNAGDPNGAVAGTTYQFCWDTSDNILYICTTSGTSSTAVWTRTDLNSFTLPYTTIAGTTQTAAVNNGYVIGNAALTTVTLPAVAGVGSVVAISGFGAGGWVLAANTLQTIKVINTSTSVAGSLASTSRYDSVQVVCVVANATWEAQSICSAGLTIV